MEGSLKNPARVRRRVFACWQIAPSRIRSSCERRQTRAGFLRFKKQERKSTPGGVLFHVVVLVSRILF